MKGDFKIFRDPSPRPSPRGRGRIISRFLASMIGLLLAMGGSGCSRSERVVVVYTSQDQVYAEPLFDLFTRETGIKVLPVFDSESVKTAGLVQRVIAEKNNPRADVFWSNEVMMARRLVDQGIIRSNSWIAVGRRSRRLIVNTNLVSVADFPRTLLELTNAKWAGRVAMAYPIYGTTAAHMIGLRDAWGDEKWTRWCEALVANKVMVVDGNSVVARLVSSGEALLGLTDSDDFRACQRNNSPISHCGALNDLWLIPNTIGIVEGAPHKKEAQMFVDFIKSPSNLGELEKLGALDSANYSDLGGPKWQPETIEKLKTIFARK